MSNDNSSNDGFGVLEMGASVTVNDEMRRAIAAEIQEINKANQATQDEIKREEISQKELKNGKNHAKKEAAELLSKAKESLEAITTSTQIFGRLHKSQQDEVVSENTPMSVANLRESIKSKKAAVQSTKTDLGQLTVSVQTLRTRNKQYKKLTQGIHIKAEADQVQMELAEAKEGAERLEATLQEELQLFESLQNKRLALEKRNKVAETKLSELAQQLEATKSDNSAKERELQKQLDSLLASNERKAMDLSDLESETASVKKSHEMLQSTLNEAEALIAKRESTQQALNEQRKTRSILNAQATELHKVVANLKASTATQQLELKDLQAQLDELTKLENSSDTEKLEAELESEKKRSEELDKALQVAESTKPDSKNLEAKNMELGEIHSDLAKAVVEADKHQKTLESLEATMKAATQEYQERVESLEADIQSHKPVTEKDYKVSSRRYKILKHGESLLDKVKSEEDMVA